MKGKAIALDERTGTTRQQPLWDTRATLMLVWLLEVDLKARREKTAAILQECGGLPAGSLRGYKSALAKTAKIKKELGGQTPK